MAAARDFHVQAHQIETFSERPAPQPKQILLGDRDSQDVDQRRQANETRLLARQVNLVEALSAASEKALGVALSIEGACSWPIFQLEEGLHVWRHELKEHQCLVHVSQDRMPNYRPPRRVDRRKGIGNQAVRRAWNRSRKHVDDRQLGNKRFWDSGSVMPMMDELVNRLLADRVEEWVKS